MSGHGPISFSIVIYILLCQSLSSAQLPLWPSNGMDREIQPRRAGMLLSGIESIFGGGSGGGSSTYKASNPSPTLSRVEITHPMCMKKGESHFGAVLLASFCVPPVSIADPPSSVPKIIYSITPSPSSPPVLLLLLASPHSSSYSRFLQDAIKDRPCDEMVDYVSSSARPEPGQATIQGMRPAESATPTMWYAVAVNCGPKGSSGGGACPNITRSSIDLQVVNQGEKTASAGDCSQVMTVAGLKDVLMDAAEGMLEVSKLRSSAAALVYLTLIILIVATTLQWGVWHVEADRAKRSAMLPVCMVLSLACLSYLSIASGGGVLERGGQWGVRKVYASRIGTELITCPIAVWFCSRLVHAPRGMRDIFLFSSFMMIATFGCASLAIPSASRWLFWGLSWVFLVVTLVGMYRRFLPLAMRRGKEVHTIVRRITAGAACAWGLALVAWGFFEGGGPGLETWAALSYSFLDLGGKLGAACVVYKGAEAASRALSQHEVELMRGRGTAGVGNEDVVGGDLGAPIGYDDDLGDLEED